MTSSATKQQIVHLAATMKHVRQGNPMCGSMGTDDDISLDPRNCTCPTCRDWIEAPTESIGAGVTGHD